MPPRRTRRSSLKLVSNQRPVLQDQASRRVLDAAAREVARAMGRAAADEYFDRAMGVRKVN